MKRFASSSFVSLLQQSALLSPVSIHPHTNRNLLNSLVQYLHRAADQSEYSASTPINCSLEPARSTFVQHKPEQSSEYRGTRLTLVYLTVQPFSHGLLTVLGQSTQAVYRKGRRPKHESSILCPFHLHATGPVG